MGEAPRFDAPHWRNYSSDVGVLADLCGLFGLGCCALVVSALSLYVVVCFSQRGKKKTASMVGGVGTRQSPVKSPRAGMSCGSVRADAAAPPVHSVTHLAVIMDGNRRYGRRSGAPVSPTGDNVQAIERLCQEVCDDETEIAVSEKDRTWVSDRYRYFLSLIQSTALDGHRQGGEKLIEFIRYCIAADVKMLTVYAFSTDNWSRSPYEVHTLMTIFFFFFDRIRQTAASDGIFIRFVSTSPERLPARIRALMEAIETESRAVSPRRITVNVCVSYSGQEEVQRACSRVVAKRLGQLSSGGAPSAEVLPTDMENEMLRSITQDEHEAEDSGVFTADVPREPQLILRTSGEQRVSNFLLYECAYSEFIFTSKTWPEVTKEDLFSSLSQYGKRDRRKGK